SGYDCHSDGRRNHDSTPLVNLQRLVPYPAFNGKLPSTGEGRVNSDSPRSSAGVDSKFSNQADSTLYITPAPSQFVAEHTKKGEVRQCRQRKRFFGSPHPNAKAAVEFHGSLP